MEARGILRETNSWVAIGYRSRRIVINTNFLALESTPRSLLELTNPAWKGKVALAYPLFGTTATHFLALRQHWGDPAWHSWCKALAANRPFLVDGNSQVVQWVGRGDASIGLTDSDDIAAARAQGMSITALSLSEESLLIPNTVAVIRRSPHPVQAQRLLEYLQSPPVVNALIKASALEGGDRRELKNTLNVNWSELLRDLDSQTAFLKETFLR